MKWRLFCGALGLVLGLMAAFNWGYPSLVQARALAPDTLPTAQKLQTATGITRFTATAGRTRGQIDLSWTYTGKAFRNTFLVERSNNQTTWTTVTPCSLYYSTKGTSYRCSDTKLTSSRLYYYRACVPATGGKTCPKTSVTASRKAP